MCKCNKKTQIQMPGMRNSRKNSQINVQKRSCYRTTLTGFNAHAQTFISRICRSLDCKSNRSSYQSCIWGMIHIKFIALAQITSAQDRFSMQNRGLKHLSYYSHQGLISSILFYLVYAHSFSPFHHTSTSKELHDGNRTRRSQMHKQIKSKKISFNFSEKQLQNTRFIFIYLTLNCKRV